MRGALNVGDNYKVNTIDPRAPQDKGAHFRWGTGRSKILETMGFRPYEPFLKEYKWTSGICGDSLRGPQDHKFGGKYYYPAWDAKRVAFYHPGQVVDFEIDLVIHHNGFFQFYLCDLDACGKKDIEASCFWNDHCRLLERAPTESCESSKDLRCGPIDPKYPSRWYLPCHFGPDSPAGEELLGGKMGTMKYRIPDDITCKHCVVQWYYHTGNFCNAEGYVEYFRSKNGPKWPKCKGQGGSFGGYNATHQACGGWVGPEEYFGCADVSIYGN